MINPSAPDYDNTPVSSKRPSFFYYPKDFLAAPYVTIITPFYNTGPIFHETAKSVLQQSFQQWEWLIINDGSNDPEAIQVLEHYRHCDPRIRVIDHDVNKGLSAARNTGFRLARTSYVVQLDSDDLLEPTAIEKWLWFLESHPEYGFVKGYSVGFGAQEYLWEKGFHHGSEFLNENLVDVTTLIRKTVHEQVGGYDESIRQGLEDWEFWLHCANSGFWGATIPEFLNWYRRRPAHDSRWNNWNGEERQRAFHEMLKNRYSKLWKGGFPQIQKKWHKPWEQVSDKIVFENRLEKKKPRLLLIVPWLTMGGADKFNLDLLEQMTQRGWEVTIVTTVEGDHSWAHEFSRFTPDIFILHRFLRLPDYPRFLRYLIQSRNPDVVLVSNSELGYLLLPYLHAYCPEPAYIDFCHMEEENWKNGGYPRLSVGYQELLDLNIVASNHLKHWMIKRGADASIIEVCYINVDPERWKPDQEVWSRVRKQLGIAEETTVILYSGRLCPQKQPRVFAQVMKRLSDLKYNFIAIVAGDGEDRLWLENYLRRHSLDRHVRLLGSVSPDRMRELMAASDIFFLPSKWEGIALSIYEAMACGLAVVGADVGGQRELVIEGCGILLPPGDEESEVKQYTQALSQLLKDSTRRLAMGQQARLRICQQFRLEMMGDRMEELFKKAIDLHSTKPRSSVSKAVGLACANLAVEYVRIYNVTDWLWLEREKGKKTADPPVPYIPLRMRFYVYLVRLFYPLYRWGKKRGWFWLDTFKNIIKQKLNVS
ncbi:putative glycosyltransferase EpsE [Moorella thermoacetica]|uniref:Putative glycosyltransferase EpsE n=1 Tax=Neomoorella thermoacetica TaxID=1525 RepID=A0A1J5N4T5_NEOTH|nr:putative glycosyltransferase EpsE [Moorella thermoacetica]